MLILSGLLESACANGLSAFGKAIAHAEPLQVVRQRRWSMRRRHKDAQTVHLDRAQRIHLSGASLRFPLGMQPARLWQFLRELAPGGQGTWTCSGSSLLLLPAIFLILPFHSRILFASRNIVGRVGCCCCALRYRVKSA